MTENQTNLNKYNELKEVFLKQAESYFGKRTEYEFDGVTYHNFKPITILSEAHLQTGIYAYEIKLHGKANDDFKDGVFQLSHEAVHLLSPVEQDEGSEVNYLEEGMATYFSEIITIRETGDRDFAINAIKASDKYHTAYLLYLQLHAIDPDSIKKLRTVQPVISNIQLSDFDMAKVSAPSELIVDLLKIF